MRAQRDDDRDLFILDPRGIHLVEQDRNDLIGGSQPGIVVGENHNFGGPFHQLPQRLRRNGVVDGADYLVLDIGHRREIPGRIDSDQICARNFHFDHLVPVRERYCNIRHKITSFQ